MLIKLYKQEGTKTLYWETWDNEGKYIVHWGTVGDNGSNKEVKGTLLKKASKIVREEEKARPQQGYKEIEDLKTIFIQYRIEGFGTQGNIDMRYDIENLMNECLGWAGLGHCDGGDIGSGSINIFCFVVDVDISCRVIKNALEEKGLISGALIVEDREEDFKLLWPSDYANEISY